MAGSAIPVEVKGAEAFAALSKRLRRESKQLRTDLQRGIRQATIPLGRRARADLAARTPSAGGLRKKVASAPVSVTQRGGGRNVGIRLRLARKGTGLRDLERGRIKHPVYGNRRNWVTQEIPSVEGQWSETIEAGRPKVQAELVKVMTQVARRLS